MRYSLSLLADQLSAALVQRGAALDEEQAVRGLDADDERALQSLFAAQLAPHYEVAREVYYPSSAGARRSGFLRCDLVLSPPGKPLARPETPSLLDALGCPPEEALWVEVKVAAQFQALGKRSSTYGDQWQRGLTRDLRKMDADTRIHEAALALVAFAASREEISAQLSFIESHFVREGVWAGFRQERFFSLVDRIGHRAGALALWPTIQRF